VAAPANLRDCQIVIFASFTTFAHLACSALMNSTNLAIEPPPLTDLEGTTPCIEHETRVCTDRKL
jgi:hypothetical protein